MSKPNGDCSARGVLVAAATLAALIAISFIDRKSVV